MKSLSRLVSAMMLLMPLTTYAHVLSITTTNPFPPEVAETSTTTATFIITNTSKALITAVDKSQYPTGSGLSTTANTCGKPLHPNQSCTISVTLVAPAAPKNIASAVQVWAKPTVDGVQSPFNIRVTSGLPGIYLEPVAVNSQLPALRDPVVAESNGEWLIASGTTGNFHQFENTYFIPNMYVYNPATTQIYSMNVASTNLPAAVKAQLKSSSVEFYEDGNTLYIIGGFYTADNVNFSTLTTITALNISGVINAIKSNNTNLAPFVSTLTGPSPFQVTGGQLGKIGNYFYLTFGQNCFGDNYCGGGSGGQVYSNSIIQFSMNPTLSNVGIQNIAAHPDGDNSGWRRRDYTLMPFMTGNTQTLFALGGPFTQDSNPNPAVVWTNGITFNGNLVANGNFLNQQANQYAAPSLSMYSAANNVSYAATFSGLSNLYWSTTGLVQDGTTPYGNILDLISYNAANGLVQEYANTQPLCSGQPLASCLYMGLTAIFMPAATGNYFDSRHILQLDQLPRNTRTLVGYIYGGLLSPSQSVFSSTPPPNGPSYTTNKVYAVYVVPSGSGAVSWRNITNLYPGIPNN